MLTVWLQSIMASAIAMKKTGGNPKVAAHGTRSKDYLKIRNEFMEKDMAATWKVFQQLFPGEITKKEELTADMIILIRNQLAHSFISSGTGFALFLPRPSSQRLVNRLTSAGWIETPDEGVSNPEMLIVREGDSEWFDRNKNMIRDFAEKTIHRITRAHGIDDAEIC